MSQPEDDFVRADVDDGKDDIGRDQHAVIRKCVNGRIADFRVNPSRNGWSDLRFGWARRSRTTSKKGHYRRRDRGSPDEPPAVTQ
jgi:hypothetical protein